MTVPGVNVIVAASFMAAIGDIRRFQNPRKLVGYLGLDPRVRQSGPAPGDATATSQSRARRARVTRSSRRAGARSASPGRCTPSMSASAPAAGTQCDRRRRAQARLPVLVLAHPRRGLRLRPASLTAKKLRRLEITAGAPRYAAKAAGIWTANDAVRHAERELAHRPRSPTAQRCATGTQPRPKKAGASATPGRASIGPRRAKPRGRPQAPDVCASLRQSLAPTTNYPTGAASKTT